MQRSTLLHALECVQGASATKSTAPAFSAVFFNGKTATTYDGELAIIAPCAIDLRGGVDHKTLKTWVAGCSGEEVVIACEGEAATFKCGRSRISVSLLDPDQLTFQKPLVAGTEIRDLDTFMASLKRTVEFMGNDPAHPARQGITIAGKSRGLLEVFATDDLTMTRDLVTVSGYSGDPLEIVIPPRFVKAMLPFGNDISSLEFGDGWLVASIEVENDCIVMLARTGSEVAVSDYRRIISRTTKGIDLWDGGTKVTDKTMTAVKNMVAVMGAMAQAEMLVTITNGVLKLSTGPGSTKVIELVKAIEHEDAKGWVVAKELLRVLEGAEKFVMTESALVAWGFDFVNLLSLSDAE